ncbi:MAG TPA: cupin-like domain-containing protein [Rheinheimera sp.]|nr:cupin-like domain-containing protein [Rheinheimera sp.]
MRSIPELDATAPSFDISLIFSAAEPVVIRGLVDHWPAITAARQSNVTLTQFLQGFDNGASMDTLLLANETEGKVGYDDQSLSKYNFERRKYPISAVLHQLLKPQSANAVRIALQSARLDWCLPKFQDQHRMPGLSHDVIGRIWIGNQAVVPAHVDHADNLALVLAGSRTFTLFPPDQVANLYIGPLQSAPTGAPISLVDVLKPDFQKFPRYRLAESAAMRATLHVGDILYLPALWWHHVQAHDDFNILLNYWWGGPIGTGSKEPSPYDALLTALFTFNDMPDVQRERWRTMFDYFVFRQKADNFGHIPPETAAIQRHLSTAEQRALLQYLQQKMVDYLGMLPDGKNAEKNSK